MNSLFEENTRKMLDMNYDEISDGSHTFEELYFHRMVLFSIICQYNKDNAWKSQVHADGTMYDGYFIAGINTSEGQYSYHYRFMYWDFFNNIKEIKAAPMWDGHESKDITRLLSLIELNNTCAVCEGIGFKLITDGRRDIIGMNPEKVICQNCNGTGRKV